MPLVSSRITQADDECEVYHDGQQWIIRKYFSEQGIGFWNNQQQRRGGAMLFRNITIPQGSLITFARIIFTPRWNNGQDIASSILEAELDPHPLPFTTYEDYQKRPRTKEYYFWWKMNHWTAWSPEWTPNLLRIIQEVIDLGNWTSGSNLVIFWHDHRGDSTPNAGTVRRAISFDYDPTRCPLLQITYEPPTPPIPPIPPPDKWAAENLEQIPVPNGYTLILHTDRPCHLWLRYTLKPPWRHAKPIFRRGIFTRGDIRFCFVNFIDVEQQESGDTLDHTWTLLDWPICQTRWFYFHGQITGSNSPSASPIFIKHRPILFNVCLFREPWTYPSPPPPTMALIFDEPWTWQALLTQLLHSEPWTYPGTPPPTMESIFTEPWTHAGAPPPSMVNLFTEPWTYPSPPPPTLVNIFTEPWTHPSPPPPAMALIFTEPWTYISPPPPSMVNLFSEPWSS